MLINAQRLSNYVKENIGFTVMLNEDVKEIDVLKFQKTLDASKWVKSSKYVSREEAASILQQDLGEDFISFLGFNPLSSSIDIHLHAIHTTSAQMSRIERELKEHALVKDVVFQKDLVDVINQNVESKLTITWVLALLFYCYSAYQQHHSFVGLLQKILIRTMKLVGATHGFIRKPFLYNGLTQGMFGALISILLLIRIVWHPKRNARIVGTARFTNSWRYYGAMLILGILMSLLATNMAVGKYLRMNEDDLYR